MPTIKLIKSKRPVTVNKKEYQKVYNTRRWKDLRAAKIRNNPVCEECARQGKTTPTKEIHHIKPFEIDNDLSLAYDYDNLISLCVECHKQAHKKLRMVGAASGRYSPGVKREVEYR
jgi:5-methylcytosine-specific restriction protein A